MCASVYMHLTPVSCFISCFLFVEVCEECEGIAAPSKPDVLNNGDVFIHIVIPKAFSVCPEVMQKSMQTFERGGCNSHNQTFEIGN